jgi:hypothetical protein
MQNQLTNSDENDGHSLKSEMDLHGQGFDWTQQSGMKLDSCKFLQNWQKRKKMKKQSKLFKASSTNCNMDFELFFRRKVAPL